MEAQAELQAQPHAAPRPRSLWRNGDYMLLWGGQTVSSIGSGVSTIAFPFLVLALTRSAPLAGLAGALRALPYVLFSLPAGALIDRWNRNRVMILCDTGRALALGSIPVAVLLHHLSVTQIFAVTFIEGALYVFFNLAEVACLPRVVPPEQLPAATGQNGATEGIALLISQPLGGLLFSLNALLPFLADAVSYVVSVVSLRFIRTRFQEARAPAARRHLGREIGEGLAWLWHQPLIRYIAFLTGGSNFVSAGSTLIIIVLAQRQGDTPLVTGVIFAIWSVGGIIGSVLGVAIQKRFSFAQVIIGTTWISALAWPFYAIAPNAVVIGLIGAVSFFVGPVYNVVQLSYRLALIPDALQGRVNSVFRLLAFGFQPLGAAAAGLLIQVAGLTQTILLFGAVLLALAVLTQFNRHVRRARPLAEVAPA
ncbi:MAG TPA: MFS transporter [Ktedonobacterales bacterium]|jgi:MFS family permease